jgi:hypothetical protein
MSSIADKLASSKPPKEVFYAEGFHYTFILTDTPGKKLAPNAYGVYEPANEAQVELLKHQVSKGLISFGALPSPTLSSSPPEEE